MSKLKEECIAGVAVELALSQGAHMQAPAELAASALRFVEEAADNGDLGKLHMGLVGGGWLS